MLGGGDVGPGPVTLSFQYSDKVRYFQQCLNTRANTAAAGRAWNEGYPKVREG